MSEELKCKECPFFKGPEIHGHGEYFTECQALFYIAHKIETNLNTPYKRKNDDYININTKDPYQYIRDKENTCKLFDKFILKDYWKHENNNI